MQAKPSLLIVCQSYVPEENQKKLWALARHFNLVCATAVEVQSMGMTVTLGESPPDQPFKLIGLKTLGDSGSVTKFIFMGLRKVLREHPADIILVESEPWALLRWQTWWLQRRYQPSALFVEYSAEDMDRSGWKGRVLDRIYRAAIATSDFVVAITERGAALFRKRGVGKRLLVNPQLGVDERLFAPVSNEQKDRLRMDAGVETGDFLIGFSGRYVEQKGILELVAAVDSVRNGMQTRRVKLALVGMGVLEKRLREMAKERPWLKLLPPRRHHEMAAFMQMLDLFVLPSKTLLAGGITWAEQLGHVLVEAMACGTPCLGSTCGEIPNVIADAAAVFPEGSASALADRLGYWIRNSSERMALAERQRERTLMTYTNAALAEKLSVSLKARLLAERRSVLWVDPHIEWRSPSMRHPMHALALLKEAGWEVRAWCERNDLPKEDIEVRLWRTPKLPPVLGLVWYFFRANAARVIYLTVKGRKPAALVHSSGAFYLGADLISVHFVNALWAKRQMELGFHTGKQFAQWALTLMGAAMDYCQFRHPQSARFLCVSDSIADDVRVRVYSAATVETLPNAYDETRFNPEVRKRWREPMREELGMAPGDKVFAFLSAGHYERKGFWLAVDALAHVRLKDDRADLKLLVIGGTESTLVRLQTQLRGRAPSYPDWIIFAGQQTEVEKYLSASDALLYPSYFEAFCLAEIEAAAMGIPLLITRHFGSEMILKDGVNGLALEWDEKLIAAKVREFLSMPSSLFRQCLGKAMTRAEYSKSLVAIYEKALASSGCKNS